MIRESTQNRRSFLDSFVGPPDPAESISSLSNLALGDSECAGRFAVDVAERYLNDSPFVIDCNRSAVYDSVGFVNVVFCVFF
jgi:hypothetical protein